MPLEHGNALLPPPVEKILPPQVMHVAVVVGVFLHRQLQQGQVLSPALASVRMVLQTDPLHVPGLGRSPVKLEHLMDRIHPAAALSPVDLVIPKHHPLPSVWEEVPNIAVEQTIHTRGPGRLYLFPPARLEHLVQIGAHAEVRILWNQLQRLVPGHIKAPGGNHLDRDLGPQLLQSLGRSVCGPCVQHAHLIRLRHGGHPAICKGPLIFADGIHNNFHRTSFSEPRGAAQCAAPRSC